LKKKVVQNAEEQKPKSEPSPVTGEIVAQKPTQAVNPQDDVPTVESVLAKIDPNKLKMAAEMGIPLDDILAIVKYQQNTLKALVEAMTKLPTNEGIAEELNRKLQANAEKNRAELVEKMKNPPQGGGKADAGSLGEILAFLKGGEGGGGDDEFSKMAKSYALESMGLGNMFQKVMMAKMAPELADTILAGVKAGAEKKAV
jgi:hypothetical protein